MARKSILRVVISKTIGFAVFLLLIYIGDYLKQYILFRIYSGIIDFLIDNLWLSFTIFFISIIAEIFWTFKFPFSAPAPILSAVSGVFVLKYFYLAWIFINGYVEIEIDIPIYSLTFLIFWIVIIAGYIIIVVRTGKEKEEAEEEKEEESEEKEKKEEGELEEEKEEKEEIGKKRIDWHDVGEEFKLVLHNIGSSLRKATEPKSAPRKRKKRR